jgi:hypothetical protein
MYNDDYATCAETYASLAIFSDDLEPGAVAHLLELPPAEMWRRGEPGNLRGQRLMLSRFAVWFLRSCSFVQSRDLRRHVDWLLDHVEPKRELLAALQAQGCQVGVSCYWLSRWGQGGPTLSPGNMVRLGNLALELWFDIDYLEDDESGEPEPEGAGEGDELTQ